MQNQDPTAVAHHALAQLAAALPFILLTVALSIGLTILINWRIVAKSGYPGASSLLALIPGVNFVVLLIFAFGEWPIERQLRALRHGALGAPPPPPQWQPPATT